MFGIVLALLVLTFSVAQYLVCPLWYPSMCAPALATAIIFGFFGAISSVVAVMVYFEQKSGQRGRRQDGPQ